MKRSASLLNILSHGQPEGQCRPPLPVSGDSRLGFEDSAGGGFIEILYLFQIFRQNPPLPPPGAGLLTVFMVSHIIRVSPPVQMAGPACPVAKSPPSGGLAVPLPFEVPLAAGSILNRAGLLLEHSFPETGLVNM